MNNLKIFLTSLKEELHFDRVVDAIQACRGGGRVALAVEDHCIRVIDSGCGVPDQIRDRLFDPFVTGRTRGLGLGATVARRCQQRQDGDLALIDTSPQGSIFALRWPTE